MLSIEQVRLMVRETNRKLFAWIENEAAELSRTKGMPIANAAAIVQSSVVGVASAIKQVAGIPEGGRND